MAEVGLKYSIRLLDGGMGLAVTLTAIPAMSRSDELTLQLVEELKQRKIVYGLDLAAIKQLFQRRITGVETLVAHGTPVRRGTDAEIELLKLPPSFLPMAGPDGRVDFRALDNISQVKAGEVISEKKPLDLGSPGINIFNMPLPAPNVKDAKHPAGRNCIVSEDELTMTAGIDGYLRWRGDKIDVVDLYVVRGDVDFNSGNVYYDGSIEIQGSVRAGFEVVAGGDLTVIGMVEGGTAVSKEGSVTVGQGTIGNSEVMAKVVAAGDVTLGRVLFAEVESRNGSITANYAVEHSELKAKGNLFLKSGPAVNSVIDVGGQIEVERRSESDDDDDDEELLQPGSSARQRREYVRVQLLPPIEVEIKRQNPAAVVDGKLLDVSAGGCRIRTAVRFKAGEEMQLQFRLPEVEGVLWMDAQVVRAVDTPADRTDSRITYAIRYREVETSVRENIAKFCQAEDFRQNRLLRDAGRRSA